MFVFFSSLDQAPPQPNVLVFLAHAERRLGPLDWQHFDPCHCTLVPPPLPIGSHWTTFSPIVSELGQAELGLPELFWRSSSSGGFGAFTVRVWDSLSPAVRAVPSHAS